MREGVRTQLGAQKVLEREVTSKVNVSDQDIRSFFDSHRAQFNLAETSYHIAQIVITPVREPQLANRMNDDATTQAEADRKSTGCVSCHTTTDARTMHNAPSVRLGCTDCHGGNVSVVAAGNQGSKEYLEARDKAHVLPKDAQVFRSSANPERAYTALLDETLDYVRFVNPGDLRSAPTACGPCHKEEVRNVSKSMMTHSAMLYGAALYNNGVLPGKDPIVGESYGPDGEPRVLKTIPPPTPE
jgi:hypothetical protein